MPRALLVFEPPDGGVPENVAQLALGLPGHGWEIEVAGPADATPYRLLEDAGVPVWRIPLKRHYREVSAELKAVGALRSLLRSGRFDLIHVHAAKAGVLGRIAALSCGVPSLYSPHCFPFVGRSSLAGRLAAIAAERTLASTGAVLCVCEQERELALTHRIAAPERLHVVHNGSAAPAKHDGVPNVEIARMKERGPVVGAVAALRRQKRLDLLLDAAPLILSKVPGASVVIVGNGPLEGELRRHAHEIGLDRDSRFAMLPFRAPATDAIAALDLYVLPSAWESFPFGLLEAMACGVPQVATDVGGNREAVTPLTGAIVPPNDAFALARETTGLLSDPSRLALAGDASRRLHAERFGLARMVTATAAIYDEVAAGDPGQAMGSPSFASLATRQLSRQASTHP